MTKRKTHDEFVKEVFDLVGNEYSVLGIYENNATKIRIMHTICDYEYHVRPVQFLGGNRCPRCNNEVKRGFGSEKKSNKSFIKEVFDLVGSDYTFLESYKGASTKILTKHNKCGHKYLVSPTNFLSGNRRRCPKCFGLNLKTTEKFKIEVVEIVGVEYDVVGEYINSHTKIIMKHSDCDSEFPVEPSIFLAGSRCPFCKFSKGEHNIKRWLDANNVNYKTQYRFKDCKYKYTLPFDFAIFNNESQVILIEYDGIQHFESIEFWGGEDTLREIQIRDKIKNDYCLSNNIPLIRIPYWSLDEIYYELRTNLSHIFMQQEIKNHSF